MIASQTASHKDNGREIMWARVKDNLSFELARLTKSEARVEISGTVLVAQENLPLRVDYRIECDRSWQTRRVQIDQSWRGVRRVMEFHHDGHGHWLSQGKDDNVLVGCTDVDLGVTPSTNALPINRLGLRLGRKEEIRAAWVQFPELKVVPTRQSYRRVSENQYEYSNPDSGFTALLTVDPDGLPVDYSGIWRRVAEGPATHGKASA
jgi:hypothetical protein